jgi:hypothetical protein
MFSRTVDNLVFAAVVRSAVCATASLIGLYSLASLDSDKDLDILGVATQAFEIASPITVAKERYRLCPSD